MYGIMPPPSIVLHPSSHRRATPDPCQVRERVSGASLWRWADLVLIREWVVRWHDGLTWPVNP
jgi:hypothetical protein